MSTNVSYKGVKKSGKQNFFNVIGILAIFGMVVMALLYTSTLAASRDLEAELETANSKIASMQSDAEFLDEFHRLAIQRRDEMIDLLEQINELGEGNNDKLRSKVETLEEMVQTLEEMGKRKDETIQMYRDFADGIGETLNFSGN
ncbi:hypothetical protein FWH09_01525 [Candidatus Saccharibacteria bacterium]|nr:hypothetical protein [Candidatus Saccharibacteria bacterium]